MSAGSNPYRLAIAGAARRRLAKLPKKDLDRIDAKTRALADNPRPLGVEKPTDADELSRVRVGDDRIVSTIDDGRRTVASAGKNHLYPMSPNRPGKVARVLPHACSGTPRPLS
jgi:mRNA interferase RelE/StbE